VCRSGDFCSTVRPGIQENGPGTGSGGWRNREGWSTPPLVFPRPFSLARMLYKEGRQELLGDHDWCPGSLSSPCFGARAGNPKATLGLGLKQDSDLTRMKNWVQAPPFLGLGTASGVAFRHTSLPSALSAPVPSDTPSMSSHCETCPASDHPRSSVPDITTCYRRPPIRPARPSLASSRGHRPTLRN